VITREESDVEILLLEPDEEVDDAFAVRSAINVIAHKNDAVFWLGIDDIPDLFKRGKAAVYVSDGECSHVGKKFNHVSYKSTRIIFLVLYLDPLPHSAHENSSLVNTHRGAFIFL
jgi:hypothetical protein